MFGIFPLGKKGTTGIPILTIFICVACIMVHVYTNHADRLALAFYPDSLNPVKMFTSVFAHADIWHLVGNLFFFYSFARTIETQISVTGYLLAFAIFVLVTNLAFAFTAATSLPTIGLSGVVWGYMGIFLFRYPGDRINCLLWILWKFKTFELPAFVFILAFLAFDVIGFRYGGDTRINYIAHFSGFIAGAMFRIGFWRMFAKDLPRGLQTRPALGASKRSKA